MKERWDLNRRAVRLLYHLDRKYFLCTLFSSLTTAIAPYIPIYFSAKIIDALTPVNHRPVNPISSAASTMPPSGEA